MKNFIIKILVIAISINFVFGENIANQEICITKNINENKRLIKSAKSFIDNNDIGNAINEINKVSISLMKESNAKEVCDCVELIQKFYEKGYKEEALKFANLLFTTYSNDNEKIRIIRLFFRDEAFSESAINLLTEIGFEDIDLTIGRIEYLAVLGQYQEAEKLANELLQSWINKDLVFFRRKFKTLLNLASNIRSSYYYPQITERYFNEIDSFSTKKQTDQLNRLKKIKSSDKIISITDMLSSRFYIDPEMGEINGISLESIQQIIENSLYEVLKDNEITFDILHAIALDIKSDEPFFSIDVLADKKDFKRIGKGRVIFGGYSTFNGNIVMRGKFLNDMEFKGILIHEITHKLMDVLYNNRCIPYRLDDIVAQSAYQKTIHDLEEKLDILKREYDYNSKKKIKTGNKFYDYAIENLLDVRNSYKNKDIQCEYIVRYPESIADGTYRDVKVQELMQPLAEYWNQYIRPEIDLYLDENGGNSIFVSDSARENLSLLGTTDLEALKFEILKSIIREEPFAQMRIEEMLKMNGDEDLIKKLKKELFDEFGEFGFLWRLIKSSFWGWYNSENANEDL